MSMPRLSALALLVIIPATSFAQRAGAGGGGGFGKMGAGGSAKDADRMIRDNADSPSLSRDLEKANPIEILLDNKKDLGLTDAEQKELKSLRNVVKDSTKTFFKTIDSTQREQKKTGGYAPTSGQMLILRRVSREAADSVRSHYVRAAQEALLKLTEEHRQPATDLLKKEIDELVAARRGGRPLV